MRGTIATVLFLRRWRGKLRGNRCWRSAGRWRNQGGTFEEAAEIFFAGLVVLAIRELMAGGRLVTNGKPFELDDANKFRAALPDLTLLQFHDGKPVSPDFYLKGDDRRRRLLFLAGGLFGRDRRFFLGGGGGDFGFFLAGLLLVGFGGFVAHDDFFLSVDRS